jgi:hypothetical protein
MATAPAAIDVTPPAPAAPPAPQDPLQPPARALIPGPSPEELLRRLEEVERLTFNMLTEARAKGHPVIDRECVKVHRDAATNLLNARADWLKQIEHERSLVSGDWVRKAFVQHDGVLASLVRSMPRSLAARILPSDAEFAEAELRRWAEEVFMKTMHATTPFPDEG